jgi:putative ATP-dependent endonuclease of OLD family
VVVEGKYDIEFLRRISRVLHTADPEVPDLVQLERQGDVTFVPFGGGELWPWSYRLADLGRPEFHLYDQESPPETEIRRQVVRIVNLRPGRRAVVTGKRSLENYLHPEAIFEAHGVLVEFSDHDPVADLVARQLYEREPGQPPWNDLPPRARRRRRNRAKQWLNTLAVDCMTATSLAERDPQGDVRFWLMSIAQMANRAL